jgi:hypothetical protein
LKIRRIIIDNLLASFDLVEMTFEIIIKMIQKWFLGNNAKAKW